MLMRIDDFFEIFPLHEEDRRRGKDAAERAGHRANGMTHTKDYEALAAIALQFRPRRLFEIGTYLGVTSDFFLSLLPECSVVSIAYESLLSRLLGKSFNNCELSRKQIGSEVGAERRPRFTQLYGNSHRLEPEALVKEYGRFDLVFVDGDHSHRGVSLDTELARNLITESGVICWHDANPKPKYADVRRFLERDLDLAAIATRDDYVGGIACWHNDIESSRKYLLGSQPHGSGETRVGATPF